MLYRSLFIIGILLSFGGGGTQPTAYGQEQETAWDYSPYRVMIWVVGPDRTPLAESLAPPLHDFFDRDLSAVWRTEITDAPEVVRVAARRDMEALTFATLTAADPILAVKRNHPEAPRIRIARDVATRVTACKATAAAIAAVTERGAAVDNPDLDGVAEILQTEAGGSQAVVEAWADETTEAVLLPRGIATTLVDPEPKLIALNIRDLVIDVFETYDKLFIVRLDNVQSPLEVHAVEIDCLMRLLGPVVSADVLQPRELVPTIGRTVIESFAPTVRIEDVGTEKIVGRVRAAGLIIDPDSPAAVDKADLLQPAVRKDDRNGDPILLEKLDWAYLDVEEVDGAKVTMELYAGRRGGLQGRRNSRTHRMAFKVRPYYADTLIRLHARDDPSQPLRGYEFYEKDMESGNFTFLGRTDWDGRFRVEKADHTLRLLYVKNGGAILAKLPTVPGQERISVADPSGDDVRLEAESFIRGVQNSIIDLVAMRDLYAARIRLRIEKGEVETAREMLNSLRDLGTKAKLTEALDNRLRDYDSLASGAQAAMIERMFTETRQMLNKHISPRLIRELEADVAAADSAPAPK